MNTKKIPFNYTKTLLAILLFLGSLQLAHASCNITLTDNITNVICYGNNTGSVAIYAQGGVAPYHYKNGIHGTLQTSNIFGNLYAGVDTFYVSDSVGCSQSIIAQISEPLPLGFSYYAANPTCSGGSDGNIYIINVYGGTGGPSDYSYFILGGTQNYESNLTSGVYQVYVYDSVGCSYYDNVYLYDPLPIQLTVTNIVPAVGTSSNGSITEVVTNGTGPYSFSWGPSGTAINNNDTSSDINISAGTYSLFVTDVNGCFTTDNPVLTSINCPTISMNDSIFPTGCAGSNVGQVFVNAYNGASPYLYSNGIHGALQSSNDFYNLPAGTDTFYTRDANGCTASIIVSVPVNSSLVFPPSVNINASSRQVCGTVVDTFNSSANNGGTTPTYQWYKNGTAISGANSASYAGAVHAGDSIYVVMTSSIQCAVPSSVMSNIVIIGAATLTPSVSITGQQLICFGLTDTFRAVPVNGGMAPTYQWYNNGVLASGVSGPTYTSSSFTSLDSIKVVMTSNAACVSPATATSLFYVYNSTYAPTVSATASITSVCGNNVDTLRAISTVGGPSPAYQWYLNGTAINSGAAMQATYVTTTLQPGDSIWVRLISNATCVSPNVVFSNHIHITQRAQTASVSITGNNQVCNGQSDTLHAVPVNGGTAPTYQWYKNGVAVSGATSATYVLSNFANQLDSITVTMTSNASCVSPTTVSSAIFLAHSNTLLLPSIAASASTTQVCGSTPDTLTSSISNGGLSPSYQWYKNGVAISGATQASYYSSALLPGDSVWVVLTSSYACVTSHSVTSNHLHFTQGSTLVPSVTITASSPHTCGGSFVDTFRTTVVNGGTSPSYHWYYNGVSAWAYSSTFAVTVNPYDSVSVTVTSNAACASPTVCYSNQIKVTPGTVTPSVSISGTSSFCSNTLSADTFRATPAFGGSSPTYVWYKNGVVQTGVTGSIFVATSFANGDSIWAVMTSNASCVSPTTATSNKIHLSISTSLSFTTLTSNSPVVAGNTINLSSSVSNALSYSWTGPNGFSSSSQNPTIALATVGMSGVYHAHAAVSSNTCGANGLLTVVVNSPNCSMTLTDSVIPASCTGLGDGQVILYATGGTAPYRYRKSSTGTYQSSNIFSNLSAGIDTFYVRDTAGCVASVIVTVHYLGVSVNTSVSITASATQLSCTSNIDTFTASGINGGTSPSYQWYKNGSAIAGATSSTYIGSGFITGDSIFVIMVNTAPCASPSAVASNIIGLHVASSLVPAVSVSAFLTQLCSSSVPDTFTATPTNGGTTPSYQWYKNGVAISGATYATYIGSGFVNGDSIAVKMTSGLTTCLTYRTVYSNTIHLSVGNVVPSVTITGPLTLSCDYHSDTFYTHPVNGGTAATYTWYKNGVALTSSFPYDQLWNTPIVNGDSIWVVMTSRISCAVPATATSNHIRINFTPIVPSVSITASATQVCTGQTDTFYAHPVNGGTAPTYQWYNNGVLITGATSPTYFTGNISSLDSVKVVMTSNASCASPASVISQPFYIYNTGTMVPSVTITANATSICAGTIDTFHAAPTNGGTAATYQWYKNGIIISGATGWTYFTTSLANGDSIWVVMNSSLACASPATVSSNKIHVTVTSAGSVTVTSNSPVLAGGTLILTASTVSGATSYSWTGPGGFTSSLQNPTRTGVTTAMAGTYSVHVTTNTCGANGSTVVSVTPAGCNITLTDSITPSGCVYNSGAVTVHASGGVAPYSYKNGINGVWQYSNAFGGLVAGTDTFYVKDTTGCINHIVATISRANTFWNGVGFATVSPTSNSPVTAGGTLNLTSHATGTISSYSWTGPNGFTSTAANPSIVNATTAASGIYQVTVYNTNNCGTHATITVVVNPSTGCNMSLIDSVTPVGCQVNSGVVKVFATGGSTPYSYKNGINGTAQTSNIFTGQYQGVDTIYVTDATGCTKSIIANITRPTNLGYPTVTATSNSPVNIGGTITLHATYSSNVGISSGALIWLGVGVPSAQQYQPNVTISPATTSDNTTYTVFVQDTTTSCSSRAQVSVVVNTSSCNIQLRDSVTPVGCAYNSGIVRIYATGGTAPYKYKNGINGTWQYGNIFSGLVAGTDTFYVKDTLTCSQSIVVPLIRTGTYPTTAPSTNTPVIPGGTISLLSNAPSATSYAWTGPNGYSSTAVNPNISSATVAMSGTYYLTVSNILGCTAVGSTYVFVGASNCNISLTDSVTNNSCFASRNAKVKLFASGGTAPYKYKKGINGTLQYSNLFTNLWINTDTFYVVDTNNCYKSIIARPSEPSYISNTLQINNPSGGLNNGSLYVFSSGGVGNNYTYHWSTGATGYSISNLAPGNYCVTATDATGCTTSICDSLSSTTPATHSPLTLYLDTVTSSSGQIASIHVRVKNFNHIVTAQATVQFDPSVVTYSSISQSAIASLTAANFGTTNAASGKVTFSWYDPTLSGVTLTDGTVLFVVNFNVVGTGGQFSPIVLGDTPTVREFDDTSLAPIASVTFPGRINVTNNVSISGQLRSWYVATGIRNATVSLHGTPSSSVLSDVNGNYSFNVVQGSVDTIIPSKNNDSLRANGVTTLDVLQVQHQVLGTYQLSGPYALIAADVNSSGSITTTDYAQIQALVLGNIATFTGNKLWDFVPASYVFPNTLAPWGFPISNVYISSNTQANQSGQDFIGIKLGDVTGDWNPALARTRSLADSVTLYVPDQTVSVNDTNILVPIRCIGCSGISGFQYNIQWDSTALAFSGIVNTGFAGSVSYGSNHASSGILSISWIDPTGGTVYVPNDSVLFYARFSAIGARGDSSFISIDSVLMPIEMIDSDLNLMPTAVMSGKVKIGNYTGLSTISAEDKISIHPNPSTSRVIVEVSAAGSEILITDISGKEVYSTITTGTNATISTQSWAAGIYTVSVKLADMTKNIKLVVIH